MEYQPYQQRVIEEHRELTERINRLSEFFQTKTFHDLDEAERVRMKAQREFMDGYAFMLQLRISAFNQKDAEPYPEF